MEITLLIMENHGIVFLNFCGNPGIIFKYKYIMIQTIYIHKNITFERDTEISPRLTLFGFSNL